MSYKRYCQQIIIDGLNKIAPGTTMNGHDLGLWIEKNMIMPRRVDNQTMALWAAELDEYYRYAIDEFGTVSNPFNDRDGFFRECAGYHVRVLVSMSDTMLRHWNDSFNVAAYKDQIIKEVLNVKELILQEVL